jgi:hypothetical protein
MQNNTTTSRNERTTTTPHERMPPIDASVLADKRKSFDMFRKSYIHNSAIEENKTLLRSRYDLAKETGK